MKHIRIAIDGPSGAGKSTLAPVSYTHLDVYKRQLQHLPMVGGHGGGQLRQGIQRDGAGAKKTFEQVPAGVDRHPNEPGLFMLLAFKDGGAEHIFQKYRLKDVLCVGIILQVQRAHPPNGIGIPFHGLNRCV